MTESDIIKLVKRTMREQLAPILMGIVVSNESQNRSSAQRFDTDSPISNLRNIQPFGFSSRAPKGTPGLVVPIAGDPTHLNLVGHFDEGRPSGSDGETLFYNAFGQLIYLSNGKIQVGSKASAENMVLGQVFKSMMDTLLVAIKTHTHVGNLGYSTSPPENAADFDAIKASPVDDGAILSDKVFTEK